MSNGLQLTLSTLLVSLSGAIEGCKPEEFHVYNYILSTFLSRPLNKPLAKKQAHTLTR